MLPIGLDSNNKVVTINLFNPKCINIISNADKDRRNYMNKLLSSSSLLYKIKELSYILIDLNKDLKNIDVMRKNNNIISVCDEVSKVISTLEVLIEEIDKRNKLMRTLECPDLASLEVKLKAINPNYETPSTIYLISHQIDLIRIKLRDDGKSYVTYFDELLSYIAKFGKKSGVGIICTSHNITSDNYPKNLIPYVTNRIAYQCSPFEFKSYFNVIGNYTIEANKVYHQEKFSKIECLNLNSI